MNDLKHNYTERINELKAENIFIKEQLNAQNELVKNILNKQFNVNNENAIVKDFSNKNRNDKFVSRAEKSDEIFKNNENVKNDVTYNNKNITKYVELLAFKRY